MSHTAGNAVAGVRSQSRRPLLSDGGGRGGQADGGADGEEEGGGQEEGQKGRDRQHTGGGQRIASLFAENIRL